MICFRDSGWLRELGFSCRISGYLSLTDWLVLKRGLRLVGFESLAPVLLDCLNC